MKKEDLKIIFMGTSWFAKEVLTSLLENKYNVSAIFTQPDKKAGRNQEFKSGPVKELANLNKLTLFQPKKLDELMTEKIKELNPDLIIVAAYGKIIPQEILEIPKFKSINIHPSLLPKFRGPSPIQNSILAGEKETGITIMLMDDRIDHGDIIDQLKINIDPEDTTETLTKKISSSSSELLLKIIPSWVEGKIKSQKQDDSLATYCQLIEKEDGHIFWNEEAEVIYNKYRAFQPWPGIFSFWNNHNNTWRIKMSKIKIEKENFDPQIKIGEVFKIGDQIGIKAAKGTIILEKIQLEGKNPVEISDFINGHPDFVGSVLK